MPSSIPTRPARALRRAMAERAQGNPFYVEELVRAFRERGDLVARPTAPTI